MDGHRFPNLCLMKLSAYHKARGDTVEWYDSAKWYDLVYMSRVFTDTYSKDYAGSVKAYHVIKGGTARPFHKNIFKYIPIMYNR